MEITDLATCFPQSIINQFSFSKVGLVFYVCLKTKTWYLAGCLRQYLIAWPWTVCSHQSQLSFINSFLSINKQPIAVDEKNAWSRQNKSNLSLSCDFQLLGCCSYLLFPPLEPESLFVATGKAQGEKNAITIHRWSVRQPLRKNTADKINSLWCP